MQGVRRHGAGTARGRCGMGSAQGAAIFRLRAVRIRNPHWRERRDRKSTRLNSSHLVISYAVFCLQNKLKPIALTTAMKRPVPRDGHPRLVRVIVLFFLTIRRPAKMALSPSGPHVG